MRRELKLYLIVMCLFKFGNTTDNNTDIIENPDEKDVLENTIDPCLAEKCINKCCPFGQYVSRKKCVPYKEVEIFSKLKVYNENIDDTGKTVPEVFLISPGKFEKDPKFKYESMNMNLIGYNPYITESGVLQLEMPNVYKRWTPIANENYCVDYLIRRRNLTSTPKFWALVEDEVYAESNLYLTVATFVSCAFMLLVLVVYIILPELHNLSGWITMAYVASLLMAFLLLAIIQIHPHTASACVGLTLGTYYFFLASFCWLSVMSYDIWWTLRGYAKARPINRRGELFKFVIYLLYAGGLPTLMTVGLNVLNDADMTRWPWFITPHVPEMSCFLEGGTKMLYLYTPMLILILLTWMFYLMTAFNIWRLNRRTTIKETAAAGTPANHRSQKNRFMVYLKLSVVMGLNWLLEIASFLFPGFKIWCVTDAYNMLIGFVIFLIFVCRKKVLLLLDKRIGLRIRHENVRSSSSTLDTTPEIITLENSTYFNYETKPKEPVKN